MATQKKVEEVVEETVEKAKTTAKRSAAKAKKAAGETTVKAKKAAVETTDKAKKTAAKAKKTVEETAAKTLSRIAKVSYIMQYQGLESDLEIVAQRAEDAFLAAHPDTIIKSLALYVKPEEGLVYYVVNGEGSDSYKISLY